MFNKYFIIRSLTETFSERTRMEIQGSHDITLCWLINNYLLMKAHIWVAFLVYNQV